jgi:mono/diheme cytochrome c family protein
MKWTERLIGSICVIVALLMGGEGWTQDASRSEAGLGLARRICSECHAVDRKPVTSPNSAAPRFETIANVPGMTAIALSVALQRSHKTMPNIILNTDERRDIVSYIMSLQRAN